MDAVSLKLSLELATFDGGEKILESAWNNIR